MLFVVTIVLLFIRSVSTSIFVFLVVLSERIQVIEDILEAVGEQVDLIEKKKRRAPQ